MLFLCPYSKYSCLLGVVALKMFEYAVIGLGLYVWWDYVLGWLVTKIWSRLKFYLELPGYELQFGSISIEWGLFTRSTRVEVQKFVWNVPRFKGYFLQIQRCEVVLDIYAFIRKAAKPIVAVERVEIEGVTVNLDRRKELNLWVALGMTEDEGAEKAQQMENDTMPDDSEVLEDVDEAEYERTAFEVRRLTVRHVKARLDAFVLKKSSDRTLTMEKLELSKKELRASKKRRSMYFDELVWKSTMALVKKATKDNPLGLATTGFKVAGQSARHSAKSASRGFSSTLMNITRTTSRDLSDSKGVEITVHEAKHLRLPDGSAKPSCYIVVGENHKSRIVPFTRNPDFDDFVVHLPSSQPLKIRAYIKQIFGDDKQIGLDLDIPIDLLPEDGSLLTDWWEFPNTPEQEELHRDKPKIKAPSVRLSLRRPPVVVSVPVAIVEEEEVS